MTDSQATSTAMGAFGILLDKPGLSIGDQSDQIAWRGLGPFNVPILVRGDGGIIFDFPSAADSLKGPKASDVLLQERDAPLADFIQHEAKLKASYPRFQYINAWFFSYMSAMSSELSFAIITIPAADPINHLKAELYKGKWILVDDRGDIIKGSDSSTSVTSALFNKALSIMTRANEVLGEEFTSVLSLFRQSCYYYSMHEFASAHLSAWFLIEQSLNRLWRIYQDESNTTISKKRRELLEGRDFTASIISQVLSLSGTISDDRLDKIDKARKARNAFSHSLKPIGEEDAKNSLTLAGEMMSEVLGVRVAPQLTYGAWL